MKKNEDNPWMPERVPVYDINVVLKNTQQTETGMFKVTFKGQPVFCKFKNFKYQVSAEDITIQDVLQYIDSNEVEEVNVKLEK